MVTRSTQKTTARKRASTSSAAKTPAAKVSGKTAPSSDATPARASAAVKPETVEPNSRMEMKKQELIEKVVKLSGIKKKDAKPVVEAMLEVLGETLAEGRGLNMQPLGKLKLNRTKEMPNARIIVAKLRQNKAAKKPGTAGNQTVAAAAE